MRRLIQFCVLVVFALALGGRGPTAAESPPSAAGSPAPDAAPAQERLVVFESFMVPGDSGSMSAGAVIDQLAGEYTGQPVLFLEQNYNNALGNRWSRWWAAYASSGGSDDPPLSMVDSGNQIHGGYVSDQQSYDDYKAMVDAALARPGRVGIQFTTQRVGNKVQFNVQLTNSSGTNLGPNNRAQVHAIVYEKHRPSDPGFDHITRRIVRGAVAADVNPLLYSGESRAFTLETEDLTSVVNWDRVRTLVLADYRPNSWTGPYDMLQAVRGEEDEPGLTVSKYATPDPVAPGATLTYTIRVVNTGDLYLHAAINDTLPEHVTYSGDLAWTATIEDLDGVWEHTFAVTVEAGYTGTLVNRVQVTSDEGASGECLAVTNGLRVYLPLVLSGN
jgi:uncharacterized repeat protein (TIGR01451 family)